MHVPLRLRQYGLNRDGKRPSDADLDAAAAIVIDEPPRSVEEILEDIADSLYRIAHNRSPRLLLPGLSAGLMEAGRRVLESRDRELVRKG